MKYPFITGNLYDLILMIKNITTSLMLVLFAIGRGQTNSYTISELFNKAPVSVFDHTTEGISLEEKNDLISKGETENWKITSKTDKILKIKCKYPSSRITFILLERQDSSPLMMSYTQNEISSTIETWELNNEGIMVKENLLPAIPAKEFFSENKWFDNISDFDKNVQYRFDTNTHLIHVELFGWMEESLKFLKPDYDITFRWTVNGFEKQKTDRDNN